MKNKRYTDEFRREAARLLIIDGVSASDVSKKLGVAQGLLYTWKQKFLTELSGSDVEGESNAVELSKELTRVRKELAREKRITEILKKTVGYFAKDEK
jgi:transposase